MKKQTKKMKSLLSKIYINLIKPSSGMTLIELIVAMTIVVIMLAGTVVFLPYYRDNQALKQGSLDLNDSLRFAQTLSLSQQEEQYTVWKITDSTEPQICVIDDVGYVNDSNCENSGKKFDLSNKLNIETNIREIFFQGKTGIMYNSSEFATASMVEGDIRLIHINHENVGDIYYAVNLNANSFSIFQNDIPEGGFEGDQTIIVTCTDPEALNYGSQGDCQYADNPPDGEILPGDITYGCGLNGCPTGQECIDGRCQDVVTEPINTCGPNVPCSTGSYCGSDGVCLPQSDIGGECDTDNECVNGNCEMSPIDQIQKCLIPLDTKCDDSNNCASGLCFGGKCSSYVPYGGRCQVIGTADNCTPGSICVCIDKMLRGQVIGQTCTCEKQ